ncbi:MAG: hypothetical protein IPO21_08370 [Bacteroidales bacterium]|nr:hypothetical protein [Bacteroidales bacterium]
MLKRIILIVFVNILYFNSSFAQNFNNMNVSFISAGVNVGFADSAGFQFGGEVSIFKLKSDQRKLIWYGMFADVLTNTEKLKVSIGPEIGWFILGFEPAYFFEVEDKQVIHGINGRVVLSLAVLHLYYRHGWGLNIKQQYNEFGLLLKMPIRLNK